MSGGSYNYAYSQLDDFASSLRETGACDAAPPALRRAFKHHCRLVAAAMRACEWNDSCDGDSQEKALIEAVLSKGAMEHISADARQRLLEVARGVIAALESKP